MSVSKDFGKPTLYSDEDVGADKSFTVPTKKIWKIHSLFVDFTTTAVVGNRHIKVIFKDSDGDPFIGFVAGALQVAGKNQFYLFAPGVPDLTSRRDVNWLSNPLPTGMMIAEGMVVQIIDEHGIDLLLDTIHIHMLVMEYDAAGS